MAVRESRRPGEDLFDFLDRTTHPHAFMHAASGTRDCCRRNDIDSVTSTRAHLVSDLSRKGHL
ncbi:hypothetical protein [Streptomyces sp. NPDC055990]|uniref:hypothetical protein n=1 Tax=Streptomyces sp. NPDC055990 TaxID=3345672 RepID=UPI0035D9EE6D